MSPVCTKSPFAAVVVLDDILTRMADHHYKKTALLSQLHSWYRDPAAADVP